MTAELRSDNRALLASAEHTYGAWAHAELIDERLGIMDHLATVPENGIVIDIGSGVGLELHAQMQLARPDISIIGIDIGYRHPGTGNEVIDIADDVLAQLSENERATLRGEHQVWSPLLLAGAAWELPLSNESADLMISHACVPIYVPEFLQRQTLAEIDRVLKPGGSRAVFGPYIEDPAWEEAVASFCTASSLRTHSRQVEVERYSYGMPIGIETATVTILEKE